jgi:hypothetical protein
MAAETDQEFVHNGRRIVISTRGGGASKRGGPAEAPGAGAPPAAARVAIDGEDIPVLYDADTGQYIATAHSPYMSHDTLTDLAKHVADHVIARRSP